MRSFAAHMLGIDRGSVLMFSDFQNGGPMWTGEGEREARRHVRFSSPFAEAPAVILGLSLWDMDRRTNLRADLVAETVLTDGFDIVFRTWGDTRVARIRVDWTALGPLHDPDLWAL